MYDIAIIGAGPAGASAAIYAAKAGKKTLVIDNDQGVTRRARIKNHYGVEDITGPDLVDLGHRQAKAFGAEFVKDKAVQLSKNGETVSIVTEGGTTYEAKHVILATGFATDLAEKSGIATKPGTEPRVKTIVDVDASGRTNIAGIWAAGTCAGVSVHTIITAGDGAKVAINIISELNGARYVDHDVL
jgi:thioredoxin reductase